MANDNILYHKDIKLGLIKQQKCFIMADNEGNLFNPKKDMGDLYKIDKLRGKSKFNLQKCNLECFQAYQAFLKTDNTAHFNVAQRRFLDGYRKIMS